MPPGAIPFPFGDCRICNDRATGIHYGLATCEGCKGFFKRSIPKGDKYKCFFGGQCVITPQNRNRCKSCRYRKCVEMGMSFEAVKMGRIPKIEKQKALNAARQMDGNWKENSSHESPDSGIDEEVHKSMNWDSVLPEVVPLPTSGFYGDMSHSRSGVAHGLSGFESMSSSVFSATRPQEAHSRDVMMQSLHEHEMTPGKIHPSLNPDRSETSNMNLLAETALLPDIPKSSPEDSIGTDSNASSGRSLYSPDVIKVLFNQVVEMTGSNKVPDIVMQRLANKCPSSSSVRLLKHLSSESYLGETPKEGSGLNDGAASHLDEFTDFSTIEGQLFTSEGSCEATWNKPSPSSTSHFRSFGQQRLYYQGDVIPCEDSLHDTENICFKSGNSVNYQTGEKAVPISVDRIMYETQDLRLAASSQQGFQHRNSMDNSYAISHDHSDQGGMWPDEDTVSSQRQTCVPLKPSPWLHANSQSTSASEMEHSGEIGDVMDKIKTEEKELDELDKDNEESFDAILQELQEALDQHHGSLRESSAKVKDYMARKIPMPRTVITDQSTKETWGQLFQAIPIANKRIIGFCGAVPGYTKLNVDDQKVLLKRAYYDIWMLTASEFFMDGESYLPFPNGTFYNRVWMEYVIKKENVKLLFSFAEGFNRLKLSELEIAILAAIQLTSPGHDDLDLKDAAAIQKLNSMYLDLLVHIVTKRNPDNSSRILIDIFRHLPKLSEINKMQQDLVANFSREAPPQ